MTQQRFFLTSAIACFLLAITLPLTAAAGDAGKQLNTASQHAGLATKADSVKKVHLHLHHVINCLVGPDGEGFDSSAGNPCDGQGNGALNDMSGDTSQAKSALKTARAGLSSDSLDTAQQKAGEAHETLAEIGSK